ncbi:hypothetical protein ACFL2Q_19075 [Thermodesulfobacteriota bacterium]
MKFLMHGRGHAIPPPALLGKITEGFRAAVKEFASDNGISVVKFEHGQRKDDIAKDLRARRPVTDEVVFVGVAQEKARTFSGRKRTKKGYVGFDYQQDKSVYVNHYYFYPDDTDFGPAFIKICGYAPWGIKVCINGHEWAKRQLDTAGIGYESLDNVFLSCDDPEKLQEICDSLGPDQINAFFQKWLHVIPLPLSPKDRALGYDWQLSMWQVEVSLTQVFDRPLGGRQFFEEVIRDNLDLGRPDLVALIFDRKITKKTAGRFRTRVIQQGVHPSLHVEYKKFHLKQYFKGGRALRTEATFNNPKDFGVNKGLRNLPYLQQLGRRINRRLLDVQRVSYNCAMSDESIEKVVQPTVTEDGQRAPGLKFGDPRVMALFLALTLFTHVIDGFCNRDLRPLVADLLETETYPYTASRMSYDLKRLRLKGIIYRQPGTTKYFLTPHGWKVTRLFSRLEARDFRPAMTAFADYPAALPPALCAALKKVDLQLDNLINQALPIKEAA